MRHVVGLLLLVFSLLSGNLLCNRFLLLFLSLFGSGLLSGYLFSGGRLLLLGLLLFLHVGLLLW
jgi:hypothetical protein